MSDISELENTQSPDEKPQRVLSPAAKRALTEAQGRRATQDANAKNTPKEINGRGGVDPARYGDWEVKGIASDF